MATEGNHTTPGGAIHIAQPDLLERAKETIAIAMPNRAHIRKNGHLTTKFVAPFATSLVIQPKIVGHYKK